jgi:hypothetical protein
MKRWTYLTLLQVLLMACALAQSRNFGVGAVFGEPTGISGKYWVSQQNAIDGALAWSFRGDGFFHIHADYLWHYPDAIRSSERFPLYVGIGGLIRFDTPARLGVRLPLGIAWWPRGIPLDVFLEIAPGLNLTPATEFGLNGGIGVRYFFS